MRSLTIVFVLVALPLGCPSAFAAPTPVLVDTCGQVVPEKAAGHLSADLDCSAFGGTAVTLGKKASLDLGGFTLTTPSGEGSYGISCDEGKCAVRNGTVTGAAMIGINGIRLLIENVNVSMSGLFAVGLGANSTVRASTISGTANVGVYESGSRQVTRIIDSTITGHGYIGVRTNKLKLVGSTVTGNGTSPDCASSPNCADLFISRKPKLKSSTCGRSQTLPNDPTPGCLGWCICTND